MYGINTQFANFKYAHECKRLLVNISWLKLQMISDLKARGIPLTDFEIEQLVQYIGVKKSHFPGSYFINPLHNTDENIFSLNSASTLLVPAYLLLSKNERLRDTGLIYSIMPAILTDENYQLEKVFDLGFDLVGKIQVYKELKP